MQTWWAREASWGRDVEYSVFSSDPGSGDMGRLHISQWSLDWVCGVGAGGGGEMASDVGGAECVVRSGADASLSVGVLGDVLVAGFLSTIER